MPTTITSAGITFNDTTSLTSGTPVDGSISTAKVQDSAITTAKIASNSVTSAKLGTNEQKQIAKAWVNFNGTVVPATGLSYTRSGTTVTVSQAGHSVTIGANVGISNATDSGINGNAFVTAVVAGVSWSFTTTATGANGTLNALASTLIRSSYNVSSISKNGTGDYTVNFATAMADANYSAIGSGTNATALTTTAAFTLTTLPSSYSTGSVRFLAQYGNGGTAYDVTFGSVQIFGN
jgi:hypothetical protein